MAKFRNNSNKTEDRLAYLLDDYRRFRKYNKVMDKLLKMVEDGASVEAIYEKFGPQLAARLVMIAISSSDPRQVTPVIKEIHDRALGKSKERQEITHRYENLTEPQLDKLIEQQEEQVKGLKEEKVH